MKTSSRPVAAASRAPRHGGRKHQRRGRGAHAAPGAADASGAAAGAVHVSHPGHAPGAAGTAGTAGVPDGVEPRDAPHPPRARGSRAAGRGPAHGPAYEDAHLDGLFTYCLSIMCEHDTATAALGEALAVAERQHQRVRRPRDPALRRPWLYALARWACLRRLAAERRIEQRTRGVAPARGDVTPRAAGGADAGRRRRELAALSWPEAAGTTPEQREALELAVRHQLPLPELARVLRLDDQAAHTLLTVAAREVERTRAALVAVESSGCPAVAVLSGDDRRLLLGPRLRGELVRHVEACPACRLVAHRAMVSARWPGTSATPGPDVTTGLSRLVVLAAPRPAVHAARLAIHRARAQHLPRFDRAGFPLPERDRAARWERLRGRALTTTAVAAVLATPVLALAAAYRAVPVTGEPDGHLRDEPGNAAPDVGSQPHGSGEDASSDGTWRGQGPGSGPSDGGGDGTGRGDGAFDGAGADGGPADGSGTGREPAGSQGQAPQPGPGTGQEQGGQGQGDGAGQGGQGGGAGDGSGQQEGSLAAVAETTADGARITLTASGGAPVAWTATADSDWLLLDQQSGTLRPGESTVVEVTVDHEREPTGVWQGRVTVEPAGAVVTVEGEGEPAQEEPDPTAPPEEEAAPVTRVSVAKWR
ncbi:BACON domain-containing protein [Streptomyces sp. 4N509B]|uniref:BACON domain-containing protein n=1 Tax=Streptomyces sp. 4N509B TaxID=3457413 RepID=UPI003FD002FE